MKRIAIGFSAALLVVRGCCWRRTRGPPADGDWPFYSRDLAGTKYSPLTQITTDNVATLTQAWSVRLVPPAPDVAAARRAAPPRAPPRRRPRPRAALRRTGAAGTGRGRARTRRGRRRVGNPPGNPGSDADRRQRRDVSARRRHARPRAGCGDRQGAVAARAAAGDLPTTARAVAYWPGDRSSAGAHPLHGRLEAGRAERVNRRSLERLRERRHGRNRRALERRADRLQERRRARRDGRRTADHGPPGDTRAFDARTGAKLWEFHTVPRPGEKGHETWLDDGWKGRSGVNNWGWTQTIDEQRGILYMAIGGPGGELLGRRPPGRQPLRELDRGRRRGDRQVQVALPDRPS